MIEVCPRNPRLRGFRSLWSVVQSEGARLYADQTSVEQAMVNRTEHEAVSRVAAAAIAILNDVDGVKSFQNAVVAHRAGWSVLA